MFQFWRSLKAVGYAVLLWRLINSFDSLVVHLLSLVGIAEGSGWMVLFMLAIAFLIMKLLDVNMGHFLGEEIDTAEDDEDMTTFRELAVHKTTPPPTAAAAQNTSQSAPTTPTWRRRERERMAQTTFLETPRLLLPEEDVP